MKLIALQPIQKRAQTITEYILIVCLLAAGSILVVKQLGDVVRAQMSAAAQRIAGQAATTRAEQEVQNIERHVKKSLDDFWKER